MRQNTAVLIVLLLAALLLPSCATPPDNAPSTHDYPLEPEPVEALMPEGATLSDGGYNADDGSSSFSVTLGDEDHSLAFHSADRHDERSLFLNLSAPAALYDSDEEFVRTALPMLLHYAGELYGFRDTLQEADAIIQNYLTTCGRTFSDGLGHSFSIGDQYLHFSGIRAAPITPVPYLFPVEVLYSANLTIQSKEAYEWSVRDRFEQTQAAAVTVSELLSASLPSEGDKTAYYRARGILEIGEPMQIDVKEGLFPPVTIEVYRAVLTDATGAIPLFFIPGPHSMETWAEEREHLILAHYELGLYIADSASILE